MTKVKDLADITTLSFIFGLSSTIPQHGSPIRPLAMVSLFMRQLS